MKDKSTEIRSDIELEYYDKLKFSKIDGIAHDRHHDIETYINIGERKVKNFI